ncbi:hypothetical protein BDY19DRAFT_997051 [Irpex rosettiformis]|uniref:Uncharacterized protein n=1 Tax=Irpex rosettiformis TaxID=378272 RepID=A0ACB8TTA2_9APHY|nr:hypothetical protein BDY19DRAFT_997051 [Irpex rosettiformis]
MSTPVVCDNRHWPMMLTEYKKRDDNYLAALGWYDVHVFGLVSNGTKAAVIQAWTAKGPNENRPPEVYITERNTCAFNLSEPFDVLHYALFLCKMKNLSLFNYLNCSDTAQFDNAMETLRLSIELEDFGQWTVSRHQGDVRKSDASRAKSKGGEDNTKPQDQANAGQRLADLDPSGKHQEARKPTNLAAVSSTSKATVREGKKENMASTTR